MKYKWPICAVAILMALAIVPWLVEDSSLSLAVSAQAQDATSEEAIDVELIRSSPPDTTPYLRDIVPEDLAPKGSASLGAEIQGYDTGAAALLGGAELGIFVVDVVVNNTNANLTNTDVANDGETSIAVNPSDPDKIVISAFSGGWGATAPIYHSLDGGLTWTVQGVPQPNGIPVTGPNDWAWDFGRNNDVYVTVLNNNDVITGLTTDPTTSGSWQWNDIGGVTQITNQVAGINGNEDQPWLLVNADPFNAAQDNVYVAYDDFDDTDGVDGPDLRVATSYGLTPPDFSAAMGGADVQVGNAAGAVNPGLRLAKDPRTGIMWAIWGRVFGPGDDDSKDMDYFLNRSTDGGATWPIGGGLGTAVAIGDSTQPRPKFGTVNALLGGVHHAAVDPTTGDLYYVYGKRDPDTNKDRLAIRKISSDGGGGLVLGSENFVTGQVEAAIPQVAVTSNGAVGVFYYTFDGFSSDDFPIFTAHFAASEDEGASFTDYELVTFLSSAKKSGVPGDKQRVLGDYMQMEAIGNCFYGSFTANGAPFGRPVANHDPIFFKTCVGPMVQVPANLDFGESCVGVTESQTLDVCSTGTENLVVEGIDSSDSQFAVSEPLSGYPVTISPDFCFPFNATFTPASAGAQAATLTVLSDDLSSSALPVQATGQAGVPDLTATLQASGDFGDVAVGAAKVLNLEVLNQGNTCDLQITNLARTGGSTDFGFAGLASGLSFPVTLPPGSNIDLPIEFAPTIFGPQAADFDLTSDDPDDSPLSFGTTGDSPPPDI